MLLPYLNVVALKDNPALISALLHRRTRYSLEDWAAFDMYESKDAWKNGLLALEFSPLCVVVHGNDYSKAGPFEIDTAHRGDIAGFPRAQLLLEAQSNLMAFLPWVVDLALEEPTSRIHLRPSGTICARKASKCPPTSLNGPATRTNPSRNLPCLILKP